MKKTEEEKKGYVMWPVWFVYPCERWLCIYDGGHGGHGGHGHTLQNNTIGSPTVHVRN